jgi:hypothetical protein
MNLVPGLSLRSNPGLELANAFGVLINVRVRPTGTLIPPPTPSCVKIMLAYTR